VDRLTALGIKNAQRQLTGQVVQVSGEIVKSRKRPGGIEIRISDVSKQLEFQKSN
jgi:hypothetical protein